jgi:hypothetical protein
MDGVPLRGLAISYNQLPVSAGKPAMSIAIESSDEL